MIPEAATFKLQMAPLALTLKIRWIALLKCPSDGRAADNEMQCITHTNRLASVEIKLNQDGICECSQVVWTLILCIKEREREREEGRRQGASDCVSSQSDDRLIDRAKTQHKMPMIGLYGKGMNSTKMKVHSVGFRSHLKK